ncbi:MAG: ankyrin repeat domain-containing protein [Cyanobacteria bacterium SID2]|nr:ankyrin repeat domain-containing protein [Cyanobacteria bacterium SID2]MBP0003304.1 ankyrin repeat domain-containing protein [Cyanobacteria bacterium SBC]
MNLAIFLILGLVLGGEACVALYLLYVIHFGSYHDGALVQGKAFFLSIGWLVGIILGILAWFLGKKTKKIKIARFWLINMAFLIIIYRILLGSFILPPVVECARSDNITCFKIHDIFINNYEIRNLNGNTALIKAAEFENLKAVDFLIESGALLDAKNKQGISALMVSSAEGYGHSSTQNYCKVVTRLIQAGANVNLTNARGENALFFATKFGNIGIVDILLKTKIDINHTNTFGRTAIEYAARYNHTIVVNKLLEAGATF